MPEPTKLQRWLDLIAFLVGRQLPVTYDELMSGVPAYAREYRRAESDTARASLRRKFERDKDELRRQGIPLRTVRYTLNFGMEEVEGYQIERRDFYLPYLKLVAAGTPQRERHGRHRAGAVEITEEEAPLALEAVRRVAEIPAFPFVREAHSAFRKLAFDLDPGAFRSGAPVLFIDPPGTAELAASVRALSEALLARKRVRFRYHGMYRDEVTERDVAAYGLLFQRGHWYLVGHDALRDAVRVFRVGRMHDVTVNERRAGTPDYEVPADFSLDAYTDREAWELGEPEEAPLQVRVRFGFPLSLYVERNGLGERVAQGPDGSQVRAFALQQVSPFLRWLLGLDGEAEILEPAGLQEELRELARAAAAANAPRRP